MWRGTFARTCCPATRAMPSEHRLHPSSILFALAGSLKAFALPAVVLLLTSGRTSPQPAAGPGLGTGAMDEPVDARRLRDRQLAVLAPALPGARDDRRDDALFLLPPALRGHRARHPVRHLLPQRAPRAVCPDPEPRCGEKRGAPAPGRDGGPRRDGRRPGAGSHDQRASRDGLRGDAAAHLRGSGGTQ